MIAELLEPTVLVFLLIGSLLGMLVGTFPGMTATMAVALASSFTLTFDPIQGLALLLPIYVAACFGDRIPAILINTPGTPASIASTFDGFPLAKQGRAGVALTVSALGSAVGSLAGVLVFAVASVPLATFAVGFGPAEMFALVVFGLTMMVSVSGANLAKGLLGGALGLVVATIGLDPITGDRRFTAGFDDLTSGIPFIAAIIGLFGIAEVLEQVLTRRRDAGQQAVTQFGRWWPNRAERREIVKPVAIGSGVGVIVGVVPAAGGDIAGLVSWDRARRMSKHPEKFGKGSLEGLAAADTANNSQMGGALVTSLALGIPGDSVTAVLLGSMIIWGITPGPSLFRDQPDLVGAIVVIMVVATVLSLALSLVRLRGVVRLLDLPAHYLWASIVVFCAVGVYSVSNSPFDVLVMLIAGLIGLGLRRIGVPAGPVVLGLLLGPLAESNLRRVLLIGDGSPMPIVTSPIAVVLLVLSVLALSAPLWRRGRRKGVSPSANSPERPSPDPDGPTPDPEGPSREAADGDRRATDPVPPHG